MSARKPGVLTIAYYFEPAGPVGGLRPWRFHRYLQHFGYQNPVVSASGASGLPPSELFVVPDTAAAFWTKRSADRLASRPTDPIPMSFEVDRFLRKTLLPGQHGLAWSRRAADSAFKALRENPQTCVLFSTYPPLGTHLAAMSVAKKLNLPWIADFRDPMAYEAESTLGRWGIGRLEKTVFQKAAAIIANTELAADLWRKRFPAISHKIHVIWNAYDPDDQALALSIPRRTDREVVHIGNLYGGRNANKILESLRRMHSKSDNPASSMRIILAGPSDETSGIDEDLHKAGVAGNWLRFENRSIPKSEAIRITQEADGLLLLQPQSAVQVPAKLFEYLSIGRPILALTPRDSSIEWILDRAGVPFVCVYSDDPAEIVDQKVAAYVKIPTAPVKANDWFRSTFDAKRLTAQLAEIVDRVAGSIPPSDPDLSRTPS